MRRPPRTRVAGSALLASRRSLLAACRSPAPVAATVRARPGRGRRARLRRRAADDSARRSIGELRHLSRRRRQRDRRHRRGAGVAARRRGGGRRDGAVPAVSRADARLRTLLRGVAFHRPGAGAVEGQPRHSGRAADHSAHAAAAGELPGVPLPGRRRGWRSGHASRADALPAVPRSAVAIVKWRLTEVAHVSAASAHDPCLSA